MKKAGCLLGLVLALGVVWLIYRSAVNRGMEAPPAQQIDTVAIRMDLLGIARAERIFVVTNGKYASLEELREERSISFDPDNRYGYRYEAEIDGDQHFRIVASPVDPARAAWPTLAVDETMQVTQVLEE